MAQMACRARPPSPVLLFVVFHDTYSEEIHAWRLLKLTPFQLDFWSFGILFVAFAVATNYWLRFMYLNKYTQLQEQPLNKPDVKELHPDVNTGNSFILFL